MMVTVDDLANPDDFTDLHDQSCFFQNLPSSGLFHLLTELYLAPRDGPEALIGLATSFDQQDLVIGDGSDANTHDRGVTHDGRHDASRLIGR